MADSRPPRQKPGVLFLGNSYYNNYYLSRALRKLGWCADVVTYSEENTDLYLHGYDYRLDHGGQWDASYPWIRIMLLSAILKQLERTPPVRNAGLNWVLKSSIHRLMKFVLRRAGQGEKEKLRFLFESLETYDIFHFTGVQNLRFLYFANPRAFGGMPLGWDVRLLKRLGKKIVYSHTGCLDGVSQTAFRTWGPEPVCGDCSWRNVPSVCSDERNLAWGRLRNQLCDYQCLLGGNRADYNVDPTIHEVPEFYCLDPNVWDPELTPPPKYHLPIAKETVKIYHAVGNLSFRSRSSERRNIKSTHVIVPMVDRLRAEGYDVELVFFHDVPNKTLRYYQLQADIVIDMLTYGFFGATAREAMMLAKPVVSFLRPEWLEQMRREIPEYVDELPIVSATPDTVYEVTKELVLDPEKRRELGRRGRQFAVKWHSADAAAKRLAAIYSGLLCDTARR